MKINKTKLVFAAISYWLKNGKTLTALITGAAIAMFQMAQLDLTPEQLEMILALIPSAGLGVAGVLHKIWKLILGLIEKQKAEG